MVILNYFYFQGKETYTPFHNSAFLNPAIMHLGTWLARHALAFDYINLFQDEKDKLKALLAGDEVLAVTTTLYVSPHVFDAPQARRRDCVLKQLQVAVLPPNVPLDHLRRLVAVYKANVQAFHRYVPAAFAGSLALFKAAQSASALDLPADYGWGALVGDGLLVQTAPGDHWTVVNSPDVDVLARHVQHYMGAGPGNRV